MGGKISLRKVQRKTPMERFIEKIKVDPEFGCWIWQGSFNGSVKTHQYAQFNVGNDKEEKTAHIWAYKQFIGPISSGLNCCHRCDNTHCVNPFHIFLGTQADNMQDAVIKGRFKRNGQSKLDEISVQRIRAQWSMGFSLLALSKKYKIDPQTVRSVILRKTWKHVA